MMLFEEFLNKKYNKIYEARTSYTERLNDYINKKREKLENKNLSLFFEDIKDLIDSSTFIIDKNDTRNSYKLKNKNIRRGGGYTSQEPLLIKANIENIESVMDFIDNSKNKNYSYEWLPKVGRSSAGFGTLFVFVSYDNNEYDDVLKIQNSSKTIIDNSITIPTEIHEKISLLVIQKFYENNINDIEEIKDEVNNIYNYNKIDNSWKNSFNTQAETFVKWHSSKYNQKRRYHYELQNGKYSSIIYEKALNLLNSSNLDLWNPADIWLFDQNILRKFRDELININDIKVLNAYLISKFESGEIIGISLKKTGKRGRVEESNISFDDIKTDYELTKLYIPIDLDHDNYKKKPFSYRGGNIIVDGNIKIQARYYNALSGNYALEASAGGRARLGRIAVNLWEDALNINSDKTKISKINIDNQYINDIVNDYKYLLNTRINIDFVNRITPEQFKEDLERLMMSNELSELEIKRIISEKAITFMIFRNLIEKNNKNIEEINKTISTLILASMKIGKENGPFLKIY